MLFNKDKVEVWKNEKFYRNTHRKGELRKLFLNSPYFHKRFRFWDLIEIGKNCILLLNSQKHHETGGKREIKTAFISIINS